VPTLDEAIALIRQFKRSSKLIVYRTSTPTPGDDYFIQKLGGPDGLTTDGIEIDKLRVKFNIERDLSKHPNRCNIEITNLSPRARAAMETKSLAVEFAAGHADVNKLLMTGDVIHASSEQKGTDWITKLQVGDNARAFAKARVSQTYKPGTTLKTILKDTARRFGQELPSNILASDELNTKITATTVVHGAVHAELSRLLTPYGYDWSIQNGRLEILKYAESRNDVLPVSEQTGMIETPEFGQASKKGKPPKMTIQHLLYAEVRPGGLIELTSRAKSGLFKVEKVTHTCDTHGDEWFTEMEVKPAARPAGATSFGFSGGRSDGGGAGSSF
jgi:hypothetical protein